MSIVIPTRERADTLVYTLASALDQRSTDFEVIVSDNFSADQTRAVVAAVDDPRVRYFNTGERLSMCGNYEFALKQCCGEYVIYIGDDDAVIPGALDLLLDKLRRLPEPVIHMWPLHVYDWPVGQKKASVAFLAPRVEPREVDLKAKGRFAVEMGGWKYYELPSPYHAAIPLRILTAIRERTGRVFHSTQPDVFTAMAIPAFADRAINLGQAITMNGRSARSNGLGFVESAAKRNIDRFLAEYGEYRFHPTLFPETAGAANMIPDAVLMARDMFPELYGDVKFGYSAMWAYVCRLGFATHAHVLSRRAAIAAHHELRIAKFMTLSAVHELAVVRRKILNRLTPLGPMRTQVPSNIHDFVKLLGSKSEEGGQRSAPRRGPK